MIQIHARCPEQGIGRAAEPVPEPCQAPGRHPPYEGPPTAIVALAACPEERRHHIGLIAAARDA
jgi:hypothetical protein